MKQEFSYLSADGHTQIHAIEWTPESEVKAVLQIAHGMVEFIERYDDFANYLAEHGIAVVGNDHLGHGRSVERWKNFGFFAEGNGNACVISDLRALQSRTAEKYPNEPYFFLGHSMGSFLARQYIQRYSSDLAGAIIMGTGWQPGFVLALAKRLCAASAKKHNWYYRDKKIDKMALGANNKRFEPARTTADWLTKDEKIVDAYLANPWNTFVFTVNGYYEMFTGIQEAQDRKKIANVRKDLPLLFVSGAEDPVGAFGKGVKKACRAHLSAGMRNVEMKLYPGDRHEILNETDRAVVYEDLLSWIEKTRAQETGA